MYMKSQKIFSERRYPVGPEKLLHVDCISCTHDDDEMIVVF